MPDITSFGEADARGAEARTGFRDFLGGLGVPLATAERRMDYIITSANWSITATRFKDRHILQCEYTGHTGVELADHAWHRCDIKADCAYRQRDAIKQAILKTNSGARIITMPWYQSPGIVGVGVAQMLVPESVIPALAGKFRPERWTLTVGRHVYVFVPFLAPGMYLALVLHKKRAAALIIPDDTTAFIREAIRIVPMPPCYGFRPGFIHGIPERRYKAAAKRLFRARVRQGDDGTVVGGGVDLRGESVSDDPGDDALMCMDPFAVLREANIQPATRGGAARAPRQKYTHVRYNLTPAELASARVRARAWPRDRADAEGRIDRRFN